MTGPLVPPGARVEHVAHAGGRVRLLRGGPDSGVPLVLVHGGGPDNAGISWHGVFDALARTRPVLALDLPGSGRTEGIPVDGSPAAMADLAAAVVAAVGGEGPAVWFGVSMGGHVVLHVALRHPAAVAGLVLVAPGGLAAHAGGRFLHPLAWLACRLPDAVLLPAARLAGRFTRAAVRAMVHDPARLPPAVVEEMAREARRGGLGYLRYNQATVGRWRMRDDLSARVGEITAPALFLHGRDDRLVAPADSLRAAAAMPHARAVLLDDCGHWVQVERPERFLEEVERFLGPDDEQDRAPRT
ncbi:alpha/beta fold hydrolase [Pseudonocardia broussonetiae]|uniref:Alpha/beta fold hydrolase n=1 Tax=Pseudonocardia broussonetiae TaxID=2736640 RepID=A0A6M6JNC1_9PSEU|nr:alpha/beta fold hydrolase [Pseudonocardia broussonetiae]QJY48610.1 alpha/beta fold hydrolase [Pseudonocardia broussonetiae]